MQETTLIFLWLFWKTLKEFQNVNEVSFVEPKKPFYFLLFKKNDKTSFFNKCHLLFQFASENPDLCQKILLTKGSSINDVKDIILASSTIVTLLCTKANVVIESSTQTLRGVPLFMGDFENNSLQINSINQNDFRVLYLILFFLENL